MAPTMIARAETASVAVSNMPKTLFAIEDISSLVNVVKFS
jgi:hypothetical protein